MKILVTGATGMVGSEVIRQAVLDPRITSVVSVVRREVTSEHPKVSGKYTRKTAGQVKGDRGSFLDPFLNARTYAIADELEVIAKAPEPANPAPVDAHPAGYGPR
jgi:uncharacterized protein YbjT (DUF2867 family)